MTEAKPVQAIPEKSADTIVIENRLRNTEVGDVITYDELTKLLGRSVREYCKGNCQTARRALEQESIFFGTVRGVGFKRLTQEEACRSSADDVQRARRASHRGIKKLAHVKYDELTEEGKRTHLATSAQLGAINLFAQNKSLKKLEGKVNGSTQPLPIGETLKMFGGGG